MPLKQNNNVTPTILLLIVIFSSIRQ